MIGLLAADEPRALIGSGGSGHLERLLYSFLVNSSVRHQLFKTKRSSAAIYSLSKGSATAIDFDNQVKTPFYHLRVAFSILQPHCRRKKQNHPRGIQTETLLQVTHNLQSKYGQLPNLLTLRSHLRALRLLLSLVRSRSPHPSILEPGLSLGRHLWMETCRFVGSCGGLELRMLEATL